MCWMRMESAYKMDSRLTGNLLPTVGAVGAHCLCHDTRHHCDDTIWYK
jgi:hypothetical protein